MHNNEKFQRLLDLGSVEHNQDWIDYLALGFSEEDNRYLLELIQNPDLNNALDTSNEVWVPLHAWRTLGQLKNNQCVEPLLALLDTVLVNDDWAIEELPTVFGMIGTSCIDNLEKYLNESHHDEFARVIAADGLKDIALKHPDARQTAVARLTHYLVNADQHTTDLNSLIVSMLIDLEARESIDVIREIYQTDKIDISHVGDIEDVEIELGFRIDRETPKPSYGGMNPTPLPIANEFLDENDTDEIYHQINFYLSEYGNDESVLDISELDGFFTAIGCSPEMIMPSAWMPAIWGGENYSPDWPNELEAKTFIGSCMLYYNNVMESLQLDYFEPLFMERVVETKKYTIVDEWCNGFLRGINMWPPLDAKDSDFLSESIESIRLFATEKGWGKLDNMTELEVERWQQKIPDNVASIHKHFVKPQIFLDNQPVTTNKTGRNDPCPCGSGKKYKKCCLH